MMQITNKYLTINKYSRPGIKMTSIKGVVVHWVGNAASSANGNRNYFDSLKNGANGIYASSQFIIGLAGEVIACMPENEVAYHAGNSHYNSNYIGIECCHPDWNGKYNSKTYASLIELIAHLSKKHGFALNDAAIKRHFDVTGKACPLWYVNNPSDWNRLKQDAIAARNGKEKPEKPEEQEVTEMVEERTVEFNGGKFTGSVIMKDGYTFLKLRDFEKAGLSVDYDAQTKTPILNLEAKPKIFEVDGQDVELDALLLRGSNYIGVRELVKVGCSVGYDEGRKVARIGLPTK